MIKKYQTIAFILLTLMSGCKNNGVKKNEMEKKEIVKTLSSADKWFKESKEVWFDRFQMEDWSDLILVNWIKDSGFFSNHFKESLVPSNNNDKHFGLYFYDYQKLGGMLKALCQEDGNDIYKGIEKISDEKYRYTTYFSVVLNSLPDPNYDEKYLWLWETYDDGSRWYFSLIIIKENDKWVIDKIERYKAVLEENTN
jgi:hypothetical protein